VGPRAEAATDGEGRLVYNLIYDADETLGFEEPSTHTVTFLEAHELYDVGEDERLPWRRVGEDWEHHDKKEFTLNDVLEDTRIAERCECVQLLCRPRWRDGCGGGRDSLFC
jgi:hypothetical protein